MVRDPSGQEILCRARGKLKKDRTDLLVGDSVLFSKGSGLTKPREGVVEERLPRRNRLHRPQVANVDLLVLVMALKDPAPDWQLASRLLVLAEREEMKALLCFNKTDLLQPAEWERFCRVFESFPYPHILTSALLGQGADLLKKKLQGAVSVLAGPSGSGKSSLLNAVQPGLALKTDFVSEKVRRGRHTTRMAELLPLDGGGAVVDTPGFSRLEFHDLQPQQLGCCFPDISRFAPACLFMDCRHISEPDCAVKEAVNMDRLSGLRYEHYTFFYRELVARGSDF